MELFNNNVSAIQLWSQRKRLGSARTTSESSEGRGTLVDMETCEILSQTGSLRRGHSRGDSAYLSNCVSITSDPFSPGIEVEDEDPDGYIIPRSAHNSGRGDILFCFVLFSAFRMVALSLFYDTHIFNLFFLRCFREPIQL